MTTPLIMDVDSGIDDAMALALAAALPELELLAVTTVAGNVPVDRSTDNTLRVLNWIGCDVPVYRGMSAPLARTLLTATRVHGNDGLGGWREPVAERGVETLTAPEAIIQIAREHEGNVDGVFVGPLTNLAVALALEPRLAGWFRNVTIMGGAFFTRGNETADAEFNIFVDPEAAAAVARSALSCTWVGLDVTRQVVVSRKMWTALSDARTPASTLVREVCRESFEVRGRDDLFLHDPLSVAVAAFPDLVGVRGGQVRVDVGNAIRGETRLVASDGAGKVAVSVEAGRFVDIFSRALGFNSS